MSNSEKKKLKLAGRQTVRTEIETGGAERESATKNKSKETRE